MKLPRCSQSSRNSPDKYAGQLHVVRSFSVSSVHVLLTLCAGLALEAHAQKPSAESMACIQSAAKRFGHTPAVLVAIGSVESGWNCAAISGKNSNGTYDIGCMQINSSWLPLLKRKFAMGEQDLSAPCTNIHIGAWILAKNKRHYGDGWRAIGAYNAVSESKRVTYAWKIKSKLAAS